MDHTRRQRGEGRIGCLIGLVLLLVAILIAYKMIPIKVKSAEMRDIVTDEARAAGNRSDKQIKAAILHKAESLELPVTDEDIVIDRRSGEIKIEVDYVVPVEFPGYTYEWAFHHQVQNPIF
jgi:predicted membrane protein